ncbi:Predicted dehydrogenase [Micromonospora phaseoli]|uniref:Predicted dehydrogenase n=1 Tax=Micromonospora phaseoli TaxID=1144548 RepID=A0A1H7DNZ7_9ACTN|nr:Gfo/Idh/MocA family oxidoreductase [Micromonospora phaseoli]PZW02306.1 putative dehydrogenase [Micromonospora phaseoli]GIJ75692.1 oxidoreductase [Micromonospora phaseoli]SEK00990.1 Predicted dehydrogenase [Micromonospora phaseoli]
MTRWGILATGHIAARFAEDLRLVPGAELVAVGSRTAESAERFAQRHGIPRAYASWTGLATDADVDVIYVATPHAAHHEAALTCLTAGRPVLLEKPFTLDLATSTEVIDAARAAGVFLMEAMWMRCNPLVLRVCELIADGAIGELTSVQASFGVAGPFPPEHRMRARALGGGALLDLGVYPVSLAHLLLGAPQHLRAWAKLGPEGTDENTGLIFGYDSGAVATLSCGMVGQTGLTASITGTTGRIDLPEPFFRPGGFTLHRAGAEPEMITEELVGSGYQYEAIEVQRCLAEGLTESPLVPHAATLEIMALLDEIRAQIGVSYS